MWVFRGWEAGINLIYINMSRRGSLISTPNKPSTVLQGSSILNKCKSAEDYFTEHRWEFKNFYEFFPMFLLDLFGLDNKRFSFCKFFLNIAERAGSTEPPAPQMERLYCYYYHPIADFCRL
jgi:hypothetical protein